MESFKDHFSNRSAGYAAFRPHYPEAMFRYLAALVDRPDSVWDCATGSGQAAIQLSRFFDKVVATDASRKQIENARPQPQVSYRVAAAEQSGLDDASQSLVTVAQALHWFDLTAFYAEVERVLKPGGILAAWSYNLFRMTPGIDRIVDQFYSETLDQYWPPERVHVEAGYSDLPFPPGGIAAPDYSMRAHWGLEHLLGYLNTWSGVGRYNRETGRDGVAEIISALQAAWPDGRDTLKVDWPLTLRVARING